MVEVTVVLGFGEAQPEAQVVADEVGRVVASIRHTTVPRIAVPTAAAKHTARGTLRTGGIGL